MSGPEIPRAVSKPRLVIDIDDDIAEGARSADEQPGFPSVTDLRDESGVVAGPSQVIQTRSGYAGAPRRVGPTAGDAAIGFAALLVRVGTVLLVAAGIGGYIYGGTDDAHRRCLEHRLGGNSSLVAEFACAAER